MTTILQGDCREILPTLAEHSVDAVVTDPPYGLGFMGKDWDRGVPGEHFWREALRVAKPGAHLIAAGAPRTHHRLMCALENAGWEIRDVVMHIYGSGFPKSLNVTKALWAMPPCRCGVAKVAGQVGAVGAALPPGLVGAGVGAVARTMPLAGSATNKAAGLGAKSGGGSVGRQGKMNSGVKAVNGQLDPVMFGTLDVAVVADRDKVAHGVGVIQPQPEALRDEVMGHEVNSRAAVNTSTIADNDALRNDGPSPALVAPRAVAPSGIAGATESGTIVGGHTLTGAIDPLRILAGDSLATELADECIHGQDDTTERLICKVCGGVIQENIPEGLGTALKPAYEPWIICRKPLEGTVAENVLKWGTEAINIDGCRIGTEQTETTRALTQIGPSGWKTYGFDKATRKTNPPGRWPANLIHDGSQMVLALFPETKSGVLLAGQQRKASLGKGEYHDGFPDTAALRDFGGDSGSAARFFYCAKASKEERGEGNNHPTVKPLALMRYLCRLVTPPAGTVLDPFCGSGSTGKAALIEGFSFIGIELNPEYVLLAKHRTAQTGLFASTGVASSVTL